MFRVRVRFGRLDPQLLIWLNHQPQQWRFHATQRAETYGPFGREYLSETKAGCVRGKVASKQWWFPNKAGIVGEKLHQNSGGFQPICEKYVSKVDHLHRWGYRVWLIKTLFMLCVNMGWILWFVGCCFCPCCFCVIPMKMDQHTGVILKDQQVHPISSLIVAKKNDVPKNDGPKFGGYTSWYSFFFCS